MLRAASLALLLLATAGTRPLTAQTAATEVADLADTAARSAAPSRNACMDALPPGALRRVVVYARAEADSSVPASAARTLVYGADALLQSAVERARATLGASGDALPSAEPTLGAPLAAWRAVGAGLVVTVHRDGRVEWSVPADRSDTAASALLARALAEVRASGESFLWPSDPVARGVESARFTFELVWPSVDSAGRGSELAPGRPALPFFSLAVPWEEPVRVVRAAKPDYPSRAYPSPGVRYGASLWLRFVVDTTGRVDRSTIRDYIPRRMQGPSTAEERQIYESFVAAAREAAARSRFVPARMGGCRVRQLVQQPYVFKLP